jgi:CubicO group peptidase (beta-lactamase class C family)
MKHFTYYILPLFFISSFLYSFAFASPTIYPINSWQKTIPEEQGMQSCKLGAMMDYIQKEQYSIDNITIVRNGYLVLDAYFWPYTKGQKHNIASCTKSIISALIGIAIDKGFIANVDQPVIDFFQDKTFDNSDNRKKSMTIENLLMMASGLNCKDTYLHQWQGLYDMRNSSDWVKYVLDLPMSGIPGEKFEYCNGVSFLLSAIIRNASEMSTLDFAKQYLFTPLDIADVDWEANPQGYHLGYGEMWLTAHDMAKIGWLYLNKGKWGNKQVIPSAWVEASTRGHIDATLFDHYGYQWWIDSVGWFNSVDYYVAVGYEGQRIFVVPEKNLVVVFTGHLTGKDSFIPKKLLSSYIIPAVSSSDALPQNKKDQTRLNMLIDEVAKATAYIWSSESEGIAKDYTFQRTASPPFQFKYPMGSEKAEIDTPGQIVKMKSPGNVMISASIVDIPKNIPIEEFGPKFYLERLKKHGSDFKITSNKEITLQGGTRAYRTDFKWLWNKNVSMTTFLVSAYTDGKCIFLNTLTWDDPERCEPIINSLNLKNTR